MMKTIRICNNLIVLFIAAFLPAMGQYTGSNSDVAYLQSVTVSEFAPGSDPMNAVDSTLTTVCEITGATPAWIQVDLVNDFYVDGFGIILPNAGELATAFTLQVSTDGAIWTDLGGGTAAAPGTVEEDVTLSGKVRYVRLLITAKDASATIAEFFVYGDPADPPTAPLALAATSISTTGFVAKWEDLTTALGFRIDISTVSNFSSYFSFYEDLDVGDVLYRNVINLTPGETYYYRLRAYNNAGTSSSSNIISVSTIKYDQTISFSTLPTKIYGDTDFAISATASSGLAVSFASSDESVVTVAGNMATVVGVGTAYITASQDGNFEYNPAPPVDRLIEVGAKGLTVSGTVAMDKVYDGDTDAVLSGATLMGVVGGDDVTLQGATSGTFAQAHVGTGILVSANMTLGGTDMDNYALTEPMGLTADISPAELSVTGAAAQNKAYDGNTDAVVAGATLTGLVGGDDVSLQGGTTGIFAQAGVGVGIDVSTSMSVTGTDTDNYNFTAPTDLTADITPRALTITAEDKNREACAANPEFTLLYEGFISGESVADLTMEPEVSCAATEASPAGNYDIVVSGAAADNYSITFINGTLAVAEDAADPVLTVQNVTVELDEEGNGSITPDDVIVSAEDNCGIADTTVSKMNFTTDDIGETVIDVTVTDVSGNSTTQFAVITVVGTDFVEEALEIGAVIYPNPTSGKVEFRTERPADALKVMDMTGKTIIDRSDLKQEESFDLSEFSNGIYIFQVKFGKELKHIKVIKK